MIGFCFLHGFERLVHVGAHGDLRDVNVAVAHGQFRKALLLDALAGRRKLRDLTELGCLGGLSAGVRVHFGIEDHDVDVFAGSQDVVQSAVADVVCPAVAAEDPDGLLRQVFLVLEDVLSLGTAAVKRFERLHKRVGRGAVLLAVVKGVEPVLACRLDVVRAAFLREDGLHVVRETVADGFLAEVDAKAVLRVVFEQGVRPRRALAFRRGGVGRGRCRAAPDGRAAGGV